MLDSLLGFSSADELTLQNTLTVMIAALSLGLLISAVYRHLRREEGGSRNFAQTLILLPAMIAMIILLIGTNVARAFSLAGAFSLIRFRSAPQNPGDISLVFFAIAAGLACGTGYIAYAALFTLLISLVSIVLNHLEYGKNKEHCLGLRILIPEDLSYYGRFDPTLDRYCRNFKLSKVRTREFGSVFELDYRVVFRDEKMIKDCMDQLRVQNGNLKVEVSELPADGES